MVGISLVDRAGTAYALDIAEDHTLMGHSRCWL
jgi:hypothetical protein